MANDTLGRSLYFHHASAFGVAGQIDRPLQQTIPTQAAISLAPSGGHGTHRIEGFNVPGVLSFRAAQVDVGGRLDQTNKCHTTHAYSVLDGLNISDVVTADKVVSRLTVYHPSEPSDPAKAEPSFSIAGSYFENLRIAGRKIDIELVSHPFNNSTYGTFGQAEPKERPAEKQREWMIGSHIADGLDNNGEIKDGLGEELEHNARVVRAVGQRFRQWDKARSSDYSGSYQCSAVKHSDLESAVRGSGLINFGGLICVPRFGVIWLAELIIHKNRRQLTMFRIHLGSPASGNIDGGGGSGGGGMTPPG